MRVLEALVVLMVLAVAASSMLGLLLLSFHALGEYRRRKARRSPWERRECSDGDGHRQVYCAKPGEQPILIGEPVEVNSPDFEQEIENRRAEARAKLMALNSW